MTRAPKASFDDMAEDYDEMFPDPDDLARREGLSLDAIFTRRGVRHVLDVACGTGIQAIGLAKLGYEVSASDVSPRMVAVAREKTQRAGLPVEIRVDDFCRLDAWPVRSFDAVVCCGNSLPLLVNAREIALALSAMAARVRRGGVVVIGLRDYGVARHRGEDAIVLPGRSPSSYVVQVRDFRSNSTRVTYVFVGPGGVAPRVHAKDYLSLDPGRLGAAGRAAGVDFKEYLDLTGTRPHEGGEWFIAVGEPVVASILTRTSCLQPWV